MTTEKIPFVTNPEKLTQILGFPYKEPPMISSLVRKFAEGCNSWEEFMLRLQNGEKKESDDVKRAALQWLQFQAKKLR